MTQLSDSCAKPLYQECLCFRMTRRSPDSWTRPQPSLPRHSKRRACCAFWKSIRPGRRFELFQNSWIFGTKTIDGGAQRRQDRAHLTVAVSVFKAQLSYPSSSYRNMLCPLGTGPSGVSWLSGALSRRPEGPATRVRNIVISTARNASVFYIPFQS
jgi:hypothetical protein